jgi:hypothetical protein
LKLKNSPSKPKTKPAKKSQSPILTTESSSDQDSNSAKNPIFVDHNNNLLADNGLISLFQEREIEEINKNNDMVQFLQDSINNLTSNKDEDIDSEDKPLNLWPLLFQKKGPELPTHSCKLKSGQAGYKKPITVPLSTSGKLVPQPLPAFS